MATGWRREFTGSKPSAPPPAGEEAQAFARRLYERVADKDLAGATAEQRAAAALSLLAFARRRLPGVAKVRVFNPTAAEHGFESRHTVVQIVNDDMPFLVDSITNELNRRELTVHLLAHPVIRGAPRRRRRPAELSRGRASQARLRIDDAYRDRPPGRRRAARRSRRGARPRAGRSAAGGRRLAGDAAARRSTRSRISNTGPHAIEEQEFLRWLEANHFTFLGYRRYRYVEDGAQAGGLRYEVIPGSALGILRRDDLRLFDAGLGGGEAMARFARGPQPLLIVKTDRESMVHRRGAMDCVIVKTHDAEGGVTGERRFVGLFTSTAYHAPALDVPLLRGRVESVLARAGLDPSGHDGKALLAILDAYPRDELFQIDTDTLYQHAHGHPAAAGAPSRGAVRAPRSGRPVRELPGVRAARALRRAVERALPRHPAGGVARHGDLDHRLGQHRQRARPGALHAEARQARQPHARSGRARAGAGRRGDLVDRPLRARRCNDRGARSRKWRDWFPTVYRDTYDAAQAKADVAPLQAALEGSDFGVRLGRRASMPPHRFTVRLFHPRKPIALSDILPLAENLGLRVLSEAPFRLQADGSAAEAWRCRCCGSRPPTSRRSISPRPARASSRRSSSCGPATLENDGLNKLVLKAGLAWREVALLRAYAKYLRQAGIPFSQDYMERALVAYPAIARGTVELFEARFDPGARRGPRRPRVDARRADSSPTALEGVATLDEDRILRRFLNAVRCSLRTNYWHDKEWISFKIDSRTIDELPAPRPLFEIFVYSPRMEGIHLRGGRVARGGIRWSDRREDFRTEILGLMKTQMVKNAVIVPTGSKGGFYVKRAAAQRHARAGPGRGHRLLPDADARHARHHRQLHRRQGRAAPIACATIRTIPISWSRPTRAPPPSPTSPMRLAREYGFWLDDAFASGGSAGYDHKKMGITARGAWESVKRHFRELGHRHPEDAVHRGRRRRHVGRRVRQRHAAQSTQTKLLAAFDHRHIFIDPDARSRRRSWAERKRLFDLPRSSWMDYDKSLISAGGGVFDRNAKSITLSAAGERGAGHRAAGDDADRPDARHPQGAGRPALFRRHRHLCEGLEREQRRCRRPRQRPDPHRRRRTSAPR